MLRPAAGERRNLAKAISVIENNERLASELARRAYLRSGKAFIIGITGPPGTGKSTLTDRLIGLYRKRRNKVGVLAIDPSSPYTGGALLGDRIRMLDHSVDEGVFIRSMASRGAAGGLAKATRRTLWMMDAAGFDIILLETVGVGQTELDVTDVADCTVVVLMPELGDEVQIMKAGIIEIGDVFVINKSDLPGAHKMLNELRKSVSTKGGWKPPILMASAVNNEGVKDVFKSLEDYRGFITETRLADKIRRGRVAREILAAVENQLLERIRVAVSEEKVFQKLVEEVLSKKKLPEEAAEDMLDRILTKGKINVRGR